MNVIKEILSEPMNPCKYDISLTDEALQFLKELRDSIKNKILDKCKGDFDKKGYSIQINFVNYESPIKGNELMPFVFVLDKNGDQVSLTY